jgi:uncharacterized protein YfaS (alpha-2-macroglobulin family)
MMKRLAVFFVSILLIFITACGRDQIKVSLFTPKTYTPGEVSQVKVKVLNNKGKPITGAKISVIFNMQGMSMKHGNVSMAPKESGNGLYIGNANLQMEGDYTAVIKVEQNGEKFEQEKRFSIIRKP